MNGIKRIICLGFVILALMLPLVGVRPVTARAPAGSAWGLIDAVNALRVAYGLAPYKVNDALMAAAQSHSEFQAANGVSAHTGKGGSDYRARALAFGYGGGAAVSVNEVIASGTSMSAQYAANMWITMDALHRGIVLSPSYTDVGAGVASSNGMTYYTLDVGYIGGAAGSAAPSTGGQTGGQTAANAPAVPLIMPVKVAEPQDDGSIVHEVEPGHTLIRIAEAYQIPLADLLALNNLTFDSIIYPGEKILIQPPQPSATPAEPAEQADAKEEAAPTSVPLPTRTPAVNTAARQVAAAVDSPPTPQISLTPTATGARGLALPADPVLLAIGGAIVLGTLLLVFGGALRRGGP
jgi:LysM repeat protein